MAIIVTFGEVGFRYSRFPKRQNVQWFRCSRIPETKMFRYSKIPKRQHVPVLQDSETEKCLQFGYYWKVKMVAGYLTLVPPLQIRTWVWITCRFQSITSKLQFKWFGDIWEANLGNMNLVKPLLNRSHYFTFRYWIWLLKWLL
ncbi:unnamed protein product [Rhizophagus irregularis]|nr:unnamed protein product [Rhizophagus irregularis]